MKSARKTFTRSKQELVENFIHEVEYMVAGMVDCVRIGDDGFPDAIESMADEIKKSCRTTLVGLNPEPKIEVEETELDNNSPRMMFRRFLSFQMQKLPREVLYAPEHEIMIHLENLALERRDIQFVYSQNYNTFHQELDIKLKELLPRLRKKYKQAELFN